MSEWTGPVESGAAMRTEFLFHGALMGYVVWFFDNGPWYAHSHVARLGAFDSLESGKRAVEQSAMSVWSRSAVSA